MVINRYVIKEVLVTMLGLTAVLLLIFISNQFMQYLSNVAAGKMPLAIVLHLMMLEIPNLLGILLPLGLFLGFIIGYGRLYADNEMTVLSAAGFSQLQLLALTLKIAAVVTIIVAVLSFWLTPKIIADRQLLLAEARSASLVSMLQSERFYDLHHGKEVVYVGDLNGKVGKEIFLAQLSGHQAPGHDQPQWQVIMANHGEVVNDASGQFIRLQNGRRYVGQPGNAEFEIDKFKQFKAKIAEKELTVHKKILSATIAELWAKRDQLDAFTELQWRISVPLSVLILAFFAVPMSRVKPRQGKYSKIFPAVIIYIMYVNCFFLARRWLLAGKLPAALGMWWIHAALLSLALILLLAPSVKQRWLQRRVIA